MSPFSKQFEIDYLSVRQDMTAIFSKLMAFLQETSIGHTQSTPYPMQWFAENHFGWVITNWQVEVSQYPVFGDKIRIETWPSNFKGFVGERNFVVYNALEQPILKAFSSWLYTDINKRKPVKPTIEMLQGYGEHYPPILDKNFVFPNYEKFATIDVYNLIVCRSDTDTNYHVNNIKYLEWMQNGIPDEAFDTRGIVEMKAVYRRECARGDKITVETLRSHNNPLEFITLIRKIEEATVITEIYTLWK